MNLTKDAISEKYPGLSAKHSDLYIKILTKHM